MKWIISNAAEIAIVVGFLERLAKEIPEDFKLFGIPIGKYDNQIVEFIGYVYRAILPKAKK